MGYNVNEHVNYPTRILHSLVPPFLGDRYKRIYVDALGPLLAIFLLNILLHYGHSWKNDNAALNTSPTECLLIYGAIVPLITFALNVCAKSSISFKELLSLLGYSLYGHVFTILTSYLLADETSNTIFFICMIVFGGSATLRLSLLLLSSIQVPAARLIVCSFVSMVQLLFLIFVHFTYMHPTFAYGSGSNSNDRGLNVNAAGIAASIVVPTEYDDANL